eukprot:8952811-Pyramimonas_sp.AAC.3
MRIIISLLYFAGPPVPITARVHSTPHKRSVMRIHPVNILQGELEVARENIPARPASDWPVMIISLRAPRPIDPS